MPGHAQVSVDEAVRECAEAQSLGIGGVMSFFDDSAFELITSRRAVEGA